MPKREDEDSVFNDPLKTKEFAKGFREQVEGVDAEKQRQAEIEAQKWKAGTPEEAWQKAQSKLTEVLANPNRQPAPGFVDPYKQKTAELEALKQMVNPPIMQQIPKAATPKQDLNEVIARYQAMGLEPNKQLVDRIQQESGSADKEEILRRLLGR